jgi:hypothetical protein
VRRRTWGKEKRGLEAGQAAHEPRESLAPLELITPRLLPLSASHAYSHASRASHKVTLYFSRASRARSIRREGNEARWCRRHREGGGGDTEHTYVLTIQAHPFSSACAAACVAWPCSAQLRRRENVFDEKHARCDRLQRRVSRKAVLAAPIGQVNRMPRRTCRPEWAPCTLRPFSSLAVGLRLPEWQLTQQRGCG